MMQRQIPMMGVIPAPALLDEALLDTCANFKQALGVSMALTRTNITDANIADSLSLLPCVWSRIKNQPKNRPAFLNPDSFNDLFAALGNVGVLQWLAYRAGYSLVPRAETKRQRLERELAELVAQERAA
jgi:hypothetical protein